MRKAAEMQRKLREEGKDVLLLPHTTAPPLNRRSGDTRAKATAASDFSSIEERRLERVLSQSQKVTASHGSRILHSHGPSPQRTAKAARPLYPYGLSSEYPYVPYDFKATLPRSVIESSYSS